MRSASSRRSVGSSRTADILSELENAPNPFSMPSDEEVFVLREEERHRKLQERERLQRLKVHEKTTWGTRQGAATLKDMGVDMYSFDVPAEEEEQQAEPKKISRAPKDKETMSEFIAKKREMFLVQMSLITKQEEIARLEQQAHARELAIKESEDMLENDEKRFEEFINENAQRAHVAMQRADDELRQKQERIQQIKRIDTEIKLVESSISRVEDNLEECRVFKEFLLECTPEDWHDIEAQKIAKQRAAEILKAEDDAAAEEKAAAEAAAEEEGAEPLPDPYAELSDEERAAKEQEDRQAAAAARAKRQVELVEQELSRVTDDDIPMYFQKPEQLIDFFMRMEEDNLFLMTRCQEAEVMFDTVKAQHDKKEREMTEKTDRLRAEMQQLADQIKVEEQRCEALQERLDQGEKDTENDALETQDRLQTEEIRKVFVLCYPEQAASDDLGAIQMLTRIEQMIEKTFSELDTMEQDPDFIFFDKEKDKQKERRKIARQEQIELAKIEQVRLASHSPRPPPPSGASAPVNSHNCARDAGEKGGRITEAGYGAGEEEDREAYHVPVCASATKGTG